MIVLFYHFSYNLYLLKFHSLLHKKGSPLMLIEEIYNNFSIWISFRNENGRKKKNKSHSDLNPSLWISSQMLYHWAILTYLSKYLKLDVIQKPLCFRFFIASESGKITVIFPEYQLTIEKSWVFTFFTISFR